ncbi:hypothetical protein [Singulisphaera sp. PoT]|uniref:hypothetical protein n=1 Tax=Singulisphaera sp. PoT TaxID=3411797 RepID=UPI003BF553B1
MKSWFAKARSHYQANASRYLDLASEIVTFAIGLALIHYHHQTAGLIFCALAMFSLLRHEVYLTFHVSGQIGENPYPSADDDAHQA